MKVSYQKTILSENISFRFNGWFQVRRDNIKCTSIVWLKTNRMMFDNDICNSKTPLIIFLN